MAANKTCVLAIKILPQLLLLLLCPALAPAPSTALAEDELVIDMLYLEQRVARPPALSNLTPAPPDQGLRGAELGVADSNTTGRFLGQRFRLEAAIVDDAGSALRIAREQREAGVGLIIANLPVSSLLALSGDEGVSAGAIIFNAGAAANTLRRASCRTGLLHTLPSRAMLADALAQFLVARRWDNWLLLAGERPQDSAWLNAYDRSARRFGASVVARKRWSFNTDLRRTAQQELPLFTQGKDYDVVLVADEIGDVGEFVPYNTWLPRPVAGTQGLTPVGWHGVIEQWGARQLQNRFQALAGRPMNAIDYAAWVAARAIAEAATRTGSNAAPDLYRYLLGDDFEIAAFKGRSLTFRQWNGQLRQPIPLVQPRAVVSQSPQPGFLHPRTELDTLGFDAPETRCAFEKEL